MLVSHEILGSVLLTMGFRRNEWWFQAIERVSNVMGAVLLPTYFLGNLPAKSWDP